jgi:hypothetical protein
MATERIQTASFSGTFLKAVVLFCGFAVVAWLVFWLISPPQTYEDQRAQDREKKAATILKEAQDKLYSGPQWIDKAKGTIQLPIDDAMDLVVNDYQNKPVQASAVKVESPYPYGLQSPAAAASPAAATKGKPASSSPSPAAQGSAGGTPEVKKP